MRHYSVQPTDWLFVKGYELLPFVKNMSRNALQIISKRLSCKCTQKFFDHANQSATDSLKTISKIAIPKTKKAADNLIGKKIAIKISSTKIVAKTSSQSSSKPVESEIENAGFDKEIPKERYISLEKT